MLVGGGGRYHEIDRDGSGTINIEEFMNSESFKSSQMFYMSKSVFKSLDKDGSGDIEIDELLPIVFPLVRAVLTRVVACCRVTRGYNHSHAGLLWGMNVLLLLLPMTSVPSASFTTSRTRCWCAFARTWCRLSPSG